VGFVKRPDHLLTPVQIELMNKLRSQLRK
jgi:hypothetical protein